MTNIDEEGEMLYYKVIQTYKDNPGMLMGEALDKHLSKYNDKVADKLKDIIFKMMNASFGGNMETVPLTPRKEVFTLNNNSKDTVVSAISFINEYIEKKSTVQEIGEALYNRYGYDELLEIINSYTAVHNANNDKATERTYY